MCVHVRARQLCAPSQPLVVACLCLPACVLPPPPPPPRATPTVSVGVCLLLCARCPPPLLGAPTPPGSARTPLRHTPSHTRTPCLPPFFATLFFASPGTFLPPNRVPRVHPAPHRQVISEPNKITHTHAEQTHTHAHTHEPTYLPTYRIHPLFSLFFLLFSAVRVCVRVGVCVCLSLFLRSLSFIDPPSPSPHYLALHTRVAFPFLPRHATHACFYFFCVFVLSFRFWDAQSCRCATAATVAAAATALLAPTHRVRLEGGASKHTPTHVGSPAPPAVCMLAAPAARPLFCCSHTHPRLLIGFLPFSCHGGHHHHRPPLNKTEKRTHKHVHTTVHCCAACTRVCAVLLATRPVV